MTAAKEMLEAEKELLAIGHEVILPKFTKNYAELENDEARRNESYKNKLNHDLIRGYFDEIRDSDAVLVLNLERKGVKGYIGGNSFLEMGFAHILDKKIFLMHDIPDMGYRDEIIAMAPTVIHNDYKRIS